MSQLLTLRWISTKLLLGAIFALCLLTACSTAQKAPSAPPLPWVVTDSATTWSAQITMPRGNLSGLCVVRVRHDSIVGAWVNEFGVQAFDFTYERQRQRIRLTHLIPPLRGFFLRRMLKKDFQTFVPPLCHRTSLFSPKSPRHSLRFCPTSPRHHADSPRLDIPRHHCTMKHSKRAPRLL